ncbi:hypothetical protein L9F63_000118, partial [Diploptera punctata]
MYNEILERPTCCWKDRGIHDDQHDLFDRFGFVLKNSSTSGGVQPHEPWDH